MTSSTPPPDGTRDDQRSPFVLVARLLAVQLLAVVAVAGVIAVVFTLAGRGTGQDTPAAATSGGTSAPSSSATSAPATSPAAPTSSAPATTTPAPVGPPPSASSTSSTSSAEDRPKVDVLNQSAGGGAAASTAAEVRSAGWRVGRVDNFSGNVASTTIYYPPGLRSEARALARDLAGPQRIRSAFSTLSGSRLSIILVR